MDAIFTLPYSEYGAINELKSKLKGGYSYYIPTSRQQKGIDFIIGSIIKSSEENFEKIKKDKEEESKVEITGNMDRLKMNPGAVNYNDILDYMNKKRRI